MSEHNRVQLPKSGWDRDNVQVIRDLEAYGWVFTLRKSGHAFGRSPDGEDSTTISPRSAARSKGNNRAVVKAWERKIAAQNKFVASVEALVDEPKNADPVIDAVILRGAEKHLREAEAVQKSEHPEVVSRRPWLSRKNSSRRTHTADLEENERVDEVTLSDGSVHWECTYPDCGFSTSVSGRSCSSHYGQQHVRHGEAAPADQRTRPVVAEEVPVAEETMRHYNPTERLWKALAEYLRGAGATDPDAFAYAALQWFHERPDLERVEDATPRADLTPEQILDRVRLLVGGRDVELEAKYAEALRTIERMTHEARGYLDVIEEGKRKVDRLEADIEAWIALAPGKP